MIEEKNKLSNGFRDEHAVKKIGIQQNMAFSTSKPGIPWTVYF